MTQIPFTHINWEQIPAKQQQGESGTACIKTIQYPGMRIRLVEYSDNYLADHWCRKGHIVYCLEGEYVMEQQNGEHHVIRQGMGYVVSDGMSSHRSVTRQKVKLLIIDGDFLQGGEEALAHTNHAPQAEMG